MNLLLKKVEDKKHHFTPYLFLLATVAIWGIGTPVIKLTVGYVPPMTFLMLRMLITAIILLPFFLRFIKKNKFNALRFKNLLIAGFLGYVVSIAFIFSGLEKTTAIQGSLLSTFTPLLITALGFYILKELVTKKEIEGILIALIGTIFIVISPIFIDKGFINGVRLEIIGNLLFLLGILFDAFYVIFVKKNISQDKIITPFIQITFGFILASIVFIPLSLVEQKHIYDKKYHPVSQYRECTPGDIDKSIYTDLLICTNRNCISTETGEIVCKQKIQNAPSFITYYAGQISSYIKYPTIIGILYMAIFSGIIAYTFFNMGLKYVEAGRASVFYYMQPLFGIPAAYVLLGEKLNIYFIIGGIVILIGIYAAEKKNFK